MKNWNNKNVSEILKEIIEPDAVDVSSIQYHDELNPILWDENDMLKPDIRNVLLKNAKRFIEFSDLENLKFKDIVLIGSMANYNYNESSDIDLHIVLDYDQISDNEEFAYDYLWMKKSMWNDRFPIKIKNHDVEMYYQDSDEMPHSTGTYSVLKNDWIFKPTKKIIDINTDNVKVKSAQLIRMVDQLEKIKDTDTFLSKYEQLKDKIKKMRKCGLEKEGEFSSENLAFKILRNKGYLKKLSDLKDEYLTKELSINENL